MGINELIIKKIVKNRVKTGVDLAFLKRDFAKKDKVSCPSNVSLLKSYHRLVKNKRIKRMFFVEQVLRTRPVRSLSGIVNVSVLTKPYACPGKCLYCPTEKGVPKSYVSGEPAVERAKTLNYDPYLQVQKRLEMLSAEGHPTDKIELRLIGGTWSYYPKQYQRWFIKECFRACNEFGRSKIFNFQTLEKEQRKNEKAKHRIIGLSIETRPDFINIEEIRRLRGFGVTMVELGVQSIYDDVLELNLRGHKVKETISATELLKNAGFKVLYQMMPNLPGSNLKKDEEMFKELFTNPDFQPDLLKIYPCALLKEAPLYKWWRAKRYKPYTEKQLIELLKSIKKQIPYYVRIQRIARDIPSKKILEGPAKISNMRQILAEAAKKEGWKCRCIRCREVKENYNSKEKLCLFRQDYKSSGGKEIFLSYENENRQKLYSLLRLRISQNNEKTSRYVIPVLRNAAIIRELHTYGQAAPIHRERVPIISPQHKGLGKKLIKEAEKITKNEFGLDKIAVISGVGARGYYRKLGYGLKEEYMIKTLK